MSILLTGAKGMIGSQCVRGLLDAGYTVVGVGRSGEDAQEGNYRYIRADLAEKEKLKQIVRENKVDRIIHLAALAHTENEKDLSWERYRHINVECAKNVFDAAGERPVLYISTVDVYGFYDGRKPVSGESPIRPVTNYGKSKAMAEAACRELAHYTIFRLSPVYTDSVKRDIQKRYYLKYPWLAYQVGGGTCFEILNIKTAVAAIVDWCAQEPKNDIRILRDEKLMWTPAYIEAERRAGRAKLVLRLPRWTVDAGYAALMALTGENEKTYLLNKAVHPLRSEIKPGTGPERR